MSSTTSSEFETRRVILFRGKRIEVLLDFDRAYCVLPEVKIPRWQRVAEQLTASLLATRGICAVSLSSLHDSPTELGSTQVRYEIMESLDPEIERSSSEQWVELDSLCARNFRDPREFQAVRQAHAQCKAHADNAALGLFGALGWFPHLERWVQGAIRKYGLRLTGKFRQLNSSSTFSLIRFETDGPAAWFKAVGVPNQQEYPLTLALAHLFPHFLPQIIATQPQVNGWLTFETEGSLLRDCSTLASWETTATNLAEIQVQSLDKTTHLLSAGGRDLRNWTLTGLVEPFFQTMDELMNRQTKAVPAPLSRDALLRLSASVRKALTALDEATIPDTVGHLDLNPGNIVCSNTGSVFLDWAEAFVGHPFCTFQYLLEHFRRAIGPDRSRETQMVARYCSAWRSMVSENSIRRALEIVPLAAVFVCAVGNNLWSDAGTLEERGVAGYFRSLTRRMEREATALGERSQPWTD